MNWLATAELWNWASPVWLIAAILTAWYLWIVRGAWSFRAAWFLLAIVALAAAFVSPIGVLADGYLFSAHMVQHLMLLLIVPLCLLLSLPEARVEAWLTRPRWTWLRRLLAIPVIGWLCGLGSMWFWHVPTLCAAATESYALGVVRSATFFVAGLLFWWQVYSPVVRLRLPPLPSVVYLFSACTGCTLLGIYITFTSVAVCPAFANPADRIGILNMLYDAGLTPAADQQLGGLLMWVPPCSLYVSAVIGVLCRWYTQPTLAPASSASLPTTIREART
ncbi:MAG: cytochrome c oxidase assembly protein [Pirellulaceae bacterium]